MQPKSKCIAAGPNMATPSSKIDDNFITKKIIKNPPIERFGSARNSQEDEGAPIYWSRAPIYWSP